MTAILLILHTGKKPGCCIFYFGGKVVKILKVEALMKSKNALIGVAIMFLVLAIAFGIVIWGNVSLSAKIAFFVCGFGSGISTGRLIGRERSLR